MKKLTALLTVILFGLTLGLLSCGGGAGGNSPSATVEKGMKAFWEKDYEKAVSFYAKKDGTKLTEEETAKLIGMLPMAMQQNAEKEGLKNIEFLEETISEDGNTAEVKYTVVYKNGEEETDDASLVKIDGEWYMLITN